MTRRRLDAELVRRGLAHDRTRAREAIAAGEVSVRGRVVTNAATMVATADALVLGASEPDEYVSRGGHKLAAALERFDVAVAGRVCLDAGASTGGFTDCLLRHGASRVYAVDVAYGQLAWSLRGDERVTAMERTNVRDVDPATLRPAPDLLTADLSFVSLRSVMADLAALGTSDLVLLVKPQFEVPPHEVGPGGVVREPRWWRHAVDGVLGAAVEAGLEARDLMASPLPGPAGNVEFLLALRGPARPGEGAAVDPERVDAALAEGEALRP